MARNRKPAAGHWAASRGNPEKKSRGQSKKRGNVARSGRASADQAIRRCELVFWSNLYTCGRNHCAPATAPRIKKSNRAESRSAESCACAGRHVFNEAQSPKLVHEEANARPSRADHLCGDSNRKCSNYGLVFVEANQLWSPMLAIVAGHRHQEECQAGRPFVSFRLAFCIPHE
jgi:hypothetical protein